MIRLLVLAGEEVDDSNVDAMIDFAGKQGFQLVSAGNYENRPLHERTLPSPYDFLEEWGSTDIREGSASDLRQVFQEMGVQTFVDLCNKTAINVWRAFERKGISGSFPTIVGTMRSLELRFLDWDLVLREPVSEMDISTRAKNALESYGVEDGAILKHLTDNELADMRNLGSGTLDVIRLKFPPP